MDIQKKYGLPSDVKFCARCVISNQRPRIEFDDSGVCGACRVAELKREIDWEARERELRILLDKHRRSDGYWDVVVPCSGGKDSVYVAHKLKFDYGMNPLTVTWAPHAYTDVGRRNLEKLIHSGIDNIVGTPNGQLHRLLTKLSTVHLGDPFQPFIYGQKAFPMRMAITHNIPLVMYGEDGEVEYGGDMKAVGRRSHNISEDMTKHYFSGMPPEVWEQYGISKNLLNFYFPPTTEEADKIGLENHFFGYYKKWIPQENYYYAVENIDFEAEPDGRSEGTYSKYASLDDKFAGFHNYFAYLKFGLGRATSDAAHEIRDGHITRDEGVALVRKFDGEFPKKHFKEFLAYINMTESEFKQIEDKFRANHLWVKNADGQWTLKNQVF